MVRDAQWRLCSGGCLSEQMSGSPYLVFCLAYNYGLNPAQPGALFTKDAMVGFCFPAFVVYVSVCYGAVGAACFVFIATFFPIVVFGTV
jgi:hypothetical protein